MKERKDYGVTLTLRMPRPLYVRLYRAVRKRATRGQGGNYSTFVREAVYEKLEREGARVGGAA